MSDSEDDAPDTPAAAAAPAQGGAFNLPQAIIQGLAQRGVSANKAYGVVGSFMGESGKGLNTNSVNAGDGSDGSDSIGFGQWNGVRAQNLKSTAADMNLPVSDPRVQVTHYFNELDGKYAKGNYGKVLSALQGADDTVAAGNDIHTRQYEVPANASAQVAARLGYGNAVANAAANGQLDKFGSITPGSQNVFDPRTLQANAGAMSANNVAGGDPGAMYAADPTPSMGIGERMTRVGAALAGISNPAQAAALLSGISKAPTPTSPLDMAVKRAQLAAILKKQNAPETPTLINDANGKGQNVQMPDGSLKFIPYGPGGATEENPTEGIEKRSDKIQNFNSQLGTNAELMDRVHDIKSRLASNPEIAANLGWTQDMKALVDNSQGKSNATSSFVKDANAFLDGSALSAASGAHFGKVTNMELASFKNAIAPNGAMNDPMTLISSLDRGQNYARNGYEGAMAGAQSLNKAFGGQVPYQLFDKDGKKQSIDDWGNDNHTRWSASDKEINNNIATILKPNHDRKVNGGAAPSLKESILKQYEKQ